MPFTERAHSNRAPLWNKMQWLERRVLRVSPVAYVLFYYEKSLLPENEKRRVQRLF
jgi:hypothetical protein